jgi:hypothetical protein
VYRQKPETSAAHLYLALCPNDDILANCADAKNRRRLFANEPRVVHVCSGWVCCRRRGNIVASRPFLGYLTDVEVPIVACFQQERLSLGLKQGLSGAMGLLDIGKHL